MTRCIIVSMNEKYVPYFSVLLASILKNTESESNYEIVVLHDNLCDECQNRLFGMIDRKDITIRFLNVHDSIQGYQFFVNGTGNRAYLSIEAYFRLLAPHLLQEYQVALYLDCDIVVRSGWDKIFLLELEGYLLAGIKDLWGNWECYDKRSGLYQYRQNELGLEDPVAYFNSGVMLLNLELMRDTFGEGKLIDIAASRAWKKHDQDVLNYVCKGRALFLDYTWNMIECPGKKARSAVPEQEYQIYENCMKDPKVIHYASRKPWIIKGVFFEQDFWAAATCSVYFQKLFMPFIEEQLIQGECFEEQAYASIRSGKIGVKFITRCIFAWIRKRLNKSA